MHLIIPQGRFINLGQELAEMSRMDEMGFEIIAYIIIIYPTKNDYLYVYGGEKEDGKNTETSTVFSLLHHRHLNLFECAQDKQSLLFRAHTFLSPEGGELIL